MASGPTDAKSTWHSKKVREDHKIFSSKPPAKILDNAQNGNAQIKKDNTTLKETKTTSWLAASHAYHAGESDKHPTSRLHALFDRVDNVGLKERERERPIDARNRQQQQHEAHVFADEIRAGFEGIGAWSAQGKN